MVCMYTLFVPGQEERSWIYRFLLDYLYANIKQGINYLRFENLDSSRPLHTYLQLSVTD